MLYIHICIYIYRERERDIYTYAMARRDATRRAAKVAEEPAPTLSNAPKGNGIAAKGS